MEQSRKALSRPRTAKAGADVHADVHGQPAECPAFVLQPA